MSTVQPALRTQLEELECHFIWGLDYSKYKLLSIRDHLEDIGIEEGYPWLGHMYNLWAYIHHTLGSPDDALLCLSKAEEAFHQIKKEEVGPWLLVHYGNLAWVHYHLDNQAESQDYVTKVKALLRDYPPPSQEDLHPEVCAEKAWTLMKFNHNKKCKAVDYFQMAIRMDPDRKEWHTSHALALDHVAWGKQMESEVLEKMRIAQKHDPENLYLASVYLIRRAMAHNVRKGEARVLAQQVLRKPVSCYNGLRPLLRLYRMYLTDSEAIDLAEEALERHPDERYLKKRLAKSYKWKVNSRDDSLNRQSLIDRAISLYKEVISLYPESSFKAKLELADLYAASINDTALANQIFEELLESEQELSEKQQLYNHYAQYLNGHLRDTNRSIDYHIMAAEIPSPTKYGKHSIKMLRKISERGRNRRCAEIQGFLAELNS